MSNPYDFGDTLPPGYGQYPLPSDLSLQQKYALGLLQQGQQAGPVAHPLGALARALQGYTGGQMLREGQREALAAQADALRGFTAAAGGGGAPAAPGPIAPLPNVGSAPVSAAGGTPMAPLTQMASLSARGETGTSDLTKAQMNISPDTGGSKSYGFFGLNSGFGPNAGRGSAAQFAQQYPSLGLTATPGTAEFDAQWRAAASKAPDQLQAAQLDWYQKNILPRVTEGLTSAGVKPEIASDPRVQSYFADRMVQQGPGSTAQHAQRIAAAFQQGGGTPEGFLAAMSAADKASLGRDFRTYLSARPQDVRGLANRVELRQAGALGTAPAGVPGIATAPPAPAAVRAPDLRLINPNLPPELRKVGAALTQERLMPPKYEIHFNPDGSYTAVDPKNPRDRQVIDAGTAERIIKFQSAETAAKAEAEATGKRGAEIALRGGPTEAAALRDDFRSLPSYKNYQASAPIYNSMNEAAARDTRAADLHLVYGLMKILDPTSVVREGEVSMAQNIGTLPQQWQGQVTSFLTSSGRLPAEVRAGMMQEAYGRMNAYEGQYGQDAKFYGGIAQRRGMDVQDIVPPIEPAKPFQPKETTTTGTPPKTAPTQGWGKSEIVR